MAEGKDGPILKLIMDKGPLAGFIRDFRSGSEIKIGRIARGNTFAIKDDGISSKHILIHFDSQTGRVGKWTVSDLGSSNGTLLNGQVLDSFTPAQLSDGDVIKIGEWTSIIVKFEDVRVDVEESKVRRNPTRRRGRNLGVVDENAELKLIRDDENKRAIRGRNLGVVDEIAEIILIKDDENKRAARGRRGKAAFQNNELAEGNGFTEREMASSKRVTRRTARNRNGVEGEVGEIEIFGRKACSRRNGRKKEEKLNENGIQDAEEMEHLVQEGETCIENEIGIKAKGTQEEGNLKSLGENGGANNKRGRGRKGRKNLVMETLTESDEGAEIGNEEKVAEKVNSEREVLEEVKENLQVKEVLQEHGKDLERLVEEEVQFAAEGCEELAGTSGVKENGGNEVDLEKMTLGEWFDYLDVHLPKQIIDATEEMILDMRQKAEKFHDFMLQQKNCRSKVELPVV